MLETQTEPSRAPASPGLRAWISRKCHSAGVLLTLAFQESQVEKFLPVCIWSEHRAKSEGREEGQGQ